VLFLLFITIKNIQGKAMIILVENQKGSVVKISIADATLAQQDKGVMIVDNDKQHTSSEVNR
jgi:hypothetical protein